MVLFMLRRGMPSVFRGFNVKTKLLMMTVAAGVLGLSGAASAEIVTATFTGTVNFVFNESGGLPPATEGDSFVATYVFDIDQATQSALLPTGGEIAGPYGLFATASVTINGNAGALPTFTSGELTGETQVFDTGSVIDAVVSGASSNHLDSNIEGTDFAWILTSPATGFSYTTQAGDQTLIQLEDDKGDLVESDIATVDITVSSSPPVPEPSTWAMILVGFAGLGFAGFRRNRTRAATIA
jgi:PEP-CTERM motif